MISVPDQKCGTTGVLMDLSRGGACDRALGGPGEPPG